MSDVKSDAKMARAAHSLTGEAGRARVLKRAELEGLGLGLPELPSAPETKTAPNAPSESARGLPLVRRVSRAELEARERAEQILKAASERARRIEDEAKRSVETRVAAAVAEATEREVARISAEWLACKAQMQAEKSGDIARIVDVAVALAERLIGEAIATEPTRIHALAVSAFEQVRGATDVRIEVCREDSAALEQLLADAGVVATLEISDSLERGSLVVYTNLGHVDARLRPQLERLAQAVRAVLERQHGGATPEKDNSGNSSTSANSSHSKGSASS